MYLFLFCFRVLIYTFQTETIEKEEIALIAYMTLVVVFLAAMVIIFFVAFQKRKNKLLLEKIEQQKKFEDIVAQTSEEIQEQTLKYIGQELHDNIGQLLSLASMQMGMLGTQIPEEIKSSYQGAQEIIKNSLTEVRSLSRSLNTDVVQKRGFRASIIAETNRLNRMKLITASVVIEGHAVGLVNKKDGLILFRILQEFISNTLKHANASKLTISLIYTKDQLIIEAKDDGVGFEIGKEYESSGLLNMKSRAELTESTYALSSQPNKGTELKIQYPIVMRDMKEKKSI